MLSVANNKTIGSAEEEEISRTAYLHFVDETIFRLKNLSAAIAVAELCMLLLDFSSGFFKSHPLNIMNMIAELMLISSSIIYFVVSKRVAKKSAYSEKQKVRLIVSYRTIIMLAVLMFIFTDIYVRHKSLGTYMVFLFILEITPAYKPITNWIQYAVFGLLTVVTYFICVSKSLNTMFGTMFIFISFAVCTDFLRRYFVSQLESYYTAKKSDSRFKQLSVQSISALASAVEAKDIYTKGHSKRVAGYSMEIARKMGYPEDMCHDVYFIGLMHDVGKIGIPDAVINKTDRLNDDEYAEIKKHPAIGYDILKQITELPGISEGARWHHERYDGKGYPDGLSGTDIPEIARIIAVSDAYDAMTSNRSYRKLMPQAAVREQIVKNSGTQFDPDIAKIMIEMIDADTEYKMHE